MVYDYMKELYKAGMKKTGAFFKFYISIYDVCVVFLRLCYKI